MGLDMYVYRLIKPSKTSEELSRLADDSSYISGYTTFSHEYDNFPPNFDNIRKATVKFHYVCEEIDHEKLKKDFNIPRSARRYGPHWGEQAEIECRYEFQDDQGVERLVKFTKTEVQRYKYKKTYAAYAMIEEELAYWRGHSEEHILYKMRDACDMSTENGGYYPMNEEMIRVVAKYAPMDYDDVSFRSNDENSLVVFHYSY